MSSNLGIGQLLPNRYNESIFTNIQKTNVLFSTGVPQPVPGGGFYELITGYPLNAREYQTTNENLTMDIYQPIGDTICARPVIIICFGGGFLTGSRNHWSIVLLAEELAKRGFVTAAIDYRLGMNMFDSSLVKRAVYRGLQDGRSAVRFFRADAATTNTYDIDPDQIFIGGHSAGAFIALHNAYLDTEIERPLSTYAGFQGNNPIPDLLELDAVGDNLGHSGHASAIFSLAGAVGSTGFLESAGDPPVIMFHSTDDGTVPYYSGEPFGDVSGLIVGSELPIVFGSGPISARASSLGLPHHLNSYATRGHGVHENGSTSLYPDIVPGISDWFYQQKLKPPIHNLSGPINVCRLDPIQTYQVEANLATYYDWQIIGGAFIQHSPASNEVIVSWDETAGNHQLLVTPYSCHGARGNQIQLDINIVTSSTNQWTAGSGNWQDPGNWSTNQIPDPCNHVVFPSSPSGYEINVPPGMQIQIKSMTTNDQVKIVVGAGASLNIIPDE